MLTQGSASGELSRRIRYLPHDAVVLGFEVLDDVSVSENSRNAEFNQVKWNGIVFWKTQIHTRWRENN